MANKIFILLILVMLPYSFAFGTLAKSSSAFVNENESARFVLLAWGQNESVKFFVKDKPQEWIVIIDPENTLLNPDDGEEYISTGSAYTRAKRISIFIKPSEAGNVTIGASSEKITQGLSIIDERDVVFHIDMKSNEKDDAVENLSLPNSNITQVENQQSQDSFIFPIIILIIIVISAVIYFR